MPEKIFSIHPDNPRCFQYQEQPFKILTSAEHYGAVLNGDFDYDIYLQEMRRTGQNATRVFTFYREKATSIPGPGDMNTLVPRPEASVMPWERVSGHGLAADGLKKFDLNRWNPAYFDRLRDYVRKCAESGVICEIVLFCNPYNQEKYDLFPCSKLSNVNGVGEDLDDPRSFMTLDAPSIVDFQERFVRKMVEELNGFDNVYYEICNEPHISGGSLEENEKKVIVWQSHIARVIRQAEENMPKRHLIAVNSHFRFDLSESSDGTVRRHDDLSYFQNPDFDIINYHYISAKKVVQGLQFARVSQARAGLTWGFLRQRDQFGKPIVFDETYSGIVHGRPEVYPINRAEAWEMILSGGAGYNNLDWSFTQSDETGSGKEPIGDGRRLNGRQLREWINILRKLLEQYDLAALVPAVGVLPESVPGYGYAALTDGQGRYIIYFSDERLYRSEACNPRALSVALTLPAGSYKARTLDPKTGAVEDLPEAMNLEIPEFAEDVAILISIVE